MSDLCHLHTLWHTLSHTHAEHTDNAIDAIGQQVDGVAKAQARLDGIGIEPLDAHTQQSVLEVRS